MGSTLAPHTAQINWRPITPESKWTFSQPIVNIEFHENTSFNELIWVIHLRKLNVTGFWLYYGKFMILYFNFSVKKHPGPDAYNPNLADLKKDPAFSLRGQTKASFPEVLQYPTVGKLSSSNCKACMTRVWTGQLPILWCIKHLSPFWLYRQHTSNPGKKCPLYASNAMAGQIPVKSIQSLC